MATYGELKAQVVADLDRDDLTDYAISMINDRISHYQKDFYYDTPVTDTSVFTNTTDVFYKIPDAVLNVDFVRLNYSSVWQWLPEVQYEMLLHADVNIPSTPAVPTCWARFGELIRLGVGRPDNVYQLELTGDGRILAPSADADSNFWTNAAFSLIRYATLAQIYLIRIKDPDSYDRCAAAADSSRRQLLRETIAKSVKSQFQPNW